MDDLAHFCVSCMSITIFSGDAPYPRHCARCTDVVCERAPAPTVDAAHALEALKDADEFFEDDELDSFLLELPTLGVAVSTTF